MGSHYVLDNKTIAFKKCFSVVRNVLCQFVMLSQAFFEWWFAHLDSYDEHFIL